jgi:hypothetical protein
MYLRLPQDLEEMRRKVSKFELKFGMTQAFGCIDGTHVPKRPQINSQDYFIYKQFFSLNVQAVCDSKGYFISQRILDMNVNGLGLFMMQKFFQIVI